MDVGELWRAQYVNDNKAARDYEAHRLQHPVRSHNTPPLGQHRVVVISLFIDIIINDIFFDIYLY
jgi:hypothetical protein